MQKKKFDGLYPALITPFKDNGNVNEKALLNVADRLIEQEAEGLYLMGSTAEAFLMSTSERNKITELLLKHIGGRCNAIVQVGTLSTADAVSMAKLAYENGADMISAVAPFYYAHSTSELKNHFLTIADATPLPFLLYNFPGYSGVEYSVEQLIKLINEPSIIGVKYTDMNLYKLERLKRNVPEALLFNGHDEVYLSACAIGVRNAIGSTFNIMLPKFKSIKNLVEQGRFDLAQKEQAHANDVIDVLIKTGVVQGIKYILTKLGYEVGDCRAPFSKLNTEKCNMLDEVLDLLEPMQ